MAETGLLGAERLRVWSGVVHETERHLRRAGALRCEGLVLWGGYAEGGELIVDAAITPAQQATFGDEVAVAVSGAELHRVNVWLFRNQRQLIAQVHSHPAEAYLSETDIAYTVVSVAGGLSIVVPDFCKGGFSLETAAVYRLDATHQWRRVSVPESFILIE